MPIVEDHPYWLLADAPPPQLSALLRSSATTSKCLTPGLRGAFVRVLDTQERERLLVALRSFAPMVAPPTAALATQPLKQDKAVANTGEQQSWYGIQSRNFAYLHQPLGGPPLD